MKRFDAGIMGSDLFKKIIDQNLNIESLNQEKTFKISQNGEFESAFKVYLNDKITKLEKVLGTHNETFQRKDFIVLMCNYVVYTKLFQKHDQKLFKRIWTLQKRAPLIQIVGHITFKSETFLKIHCPSEAGSKLDPKDMRQYRVDYLKSLDSVYRARMEDQYLKMCEWCSQINLPCFSDMPTTPKDIRTMCAILLNGISLASQVKILTDDLLLLHYTEQVTITEDLFIPILNGMSIIKGVDLEISSKITQISLTLPIMKRAIQDQMLRIWKVGLGEVEKMAKSEWKDFLRYVFTVASESARGTLTYTRLRFIHLLSPILSLKELVKAENQSVMEDCFSRMNVLSEFERTLYNVTHLDYFYKIRKYASMFFKLILQQKTSFHFMKYLFRVLEDSRRLLNKVAYLEKKDQLMTQYKKEIMSMFVKEIIDPIVNKVSNSLSLKIHTYYIDKIRAENPYEEEYLDIKNIVSCDSLFLFGERINIKAMIEEKMIKQFYDISAFNPNDWQTYEDMKTLAFNLFGLELQDNLLPPQKLEQGMDIIAIVKKLRDFIPNYHFSIHTQVLLALTS